MLTCHMQTLCQTHVCNGLAQQRLMLDSLPDACIVLVRSKLVAIELPSHMCLTGL